MKIKIIDPGVYRFEPEHDEVPAWKLTKQNLVDQGWSHSLADLVAPYLSNGQPHSADELGTEHRQQPLALKISPKL